MKKFIDILDGLNLDEVEIDDQGFYEDDYEIECYYDVKEYNAERTDYTGGITFDGSTINPFDHYDENGNLNQKGFDSAIRQEIQKAINDEERLGPVYVVA